MLAKIVGCITDNVPNIVKAVQINKWWHIGCFAHTLNFIVQSSLEPIETIRYRSKSIVEYSSN